MHTSITVYAAKPNLVYTILESDATGRIESGTDGKVVWENSLLKGPAIKSGVERSNTLRDFTFDRLAYWDKIYEKAECIGKQDVAGRPCWKVVLTPSSTGEEEPQPLVLYVDEQVGLISMFETTVVTAAGAIPVEARLSDYQKVDGIYIAHRLVTKLLNQERVMQLTSVKHNQQFSEDRFDVPSEVRALLDKP